MNTRISLRHVKVPAVWCLLALSLMPFAARSGVETLAFVESPPASALFFGAVTNAFDAVGSASPDDWTFDAEAGDRLSARIETAIGAAYPRLRLLNPSGQTIASVDGSASGIAEFHNVALTVPGGYRVRVYSDHQVSEYQLRVDLSRGPSLEAEPNQTPATANSPLPSLLAGSFQIRFAGTLAADDTPGDYVALGTLDPGNTVAGELFTGPHSSLQPGDASVALFRSGDPNPVLSSTATFNYTVVDRGTYHALVSSEARRGLFARYLATLAVSDTVPPTVLSLTLPGDGSTAADIVNRFTVTFSEPLSPDTLLNPASFSLRQAGTDGAFGTPDDVLYLLAPPTYASSTPETVSFGLLDGPLQTGLTRFTASSTVTDRAGNPLTPSLTRTFTIARLDDFQFENRSNDTLADATTLSLAP
ncbi:MAG TPA: Ig-like domain-containing protein, partial [Verrucomicrobiota bacterium]|nr:Ig-like domain-containing protein [Verrucomicrobiota bacterium]HNU53042.1 Ig-like domain-containing protein [Verrucomicrobiota bacterium]